MFVTSLAFKPFVIERKTASGKSWSKVIVGEAKSLSRAMDKMIAAGRQGGEFRIRRITDDPPVTVIARSFAAPEPRKVEWVK